MYSYFIFYFGPLQGDDGIPRFYPTSVFIERIWEFHASVKFFHIIRVLFYFVRLYVSLMPRVCFPIERYPCRRSAWRSFRFERLFVLPTNRLNEVLTTYNTVN